MSFLPLLSAVLGARRKRHGRAARFLGGGPSSFLNASTLLTAAGLAVGAYEVYRTSRGSGSSSTTTVIGNPPPVSTTTVVGDVPQGAGPLPTSEGSSAARSSTDARERLVRLALSAARADGTLGEEEYAKIIAAAREVGLEPLVSSEFGKPRSLSEIVSGVRDPKEKADLYVLAFTIVRADEDVSGAERIYLAQLASALALDPATTARLEQETAERIDRAG